jgi:hypothetical protein
MRPGAPGRRRSCRPPWSGSGAVRAAWPGRLVRVTASNSPFRRAGTGRCLLVLWVRRAGDGGRSVHRAAVGDGLPGVRETGWEDLSMALEVIEIRPGSGGRR